ncbi:MAG: class I SAM-dependent methyltransferase [Candidatus Bathyarchaeia archaeon]
MFAKVKKHVGLVNHFEGLRFKKWLDNHAYEFLENVGLKTGQVVLDFGCGSGTYTIPAAKLVGEAGSVYALDIDKNALTKLEKKAERYGLKNIIRIDAQEEGDIPLESESMDFILLIDVLHEIKDRDKLLEKLYRLLKRGGLLIVYPMHIDGEGIKKIATEKLLVLKEKKFNRHIFVFTKTNQLIRDYRLGFI